MSINRSLNTVFTANGIWHNSNVRHSRCVLHNSKELGLLTFTVEHNSCPSLSNYIYIYILYITLYNTP